MLNIKSETRQKENKDTYKKAISTQQYTSIVKLTVLLHETNNSYKRCKFVTKQKLPSHFQRECPLEPNKKCERHGIRHSA